jgi:hypothetical protein
LLHRNRRFRSGNHQRRHRVTDDSGLILDGNSPWAKAYDPARTITKNVGEYLSENLTALRSFAEYFTMGDIANIERLKPGEGALLRSGLKKIAVCRDQQGHFAYALGRLHAYGLRRPLELARAVLGLPLPWLSIRTGRHCLEWSCSGTACRLPPPASPRIGGMSEARAQQREQKRRTGVSSPFRIARRGMSQSGTARIFRIETIGRKVAIARSQTTQFETGNFPRTARYVQQFSV